MTSKAYRAACSYILGLLDAQTEFDFALDNVIYYCEKIFPHEDFEAFRKTELIQEEIGFLKEWLNELLEYSSPHADISILWFYLVCENLNASYSIDFCFAGDKKQELEKYRASFIDSPDYLPERHLAHSKLLESWSKTIDELSFDTSFFVEYVLGMTYSSFAARDLATYFAQRLTAPKPRLVKAGFRLGDAIRVGVIENGTFTINK
ncbi:MAG: hypothetical protein PHD88_07905 [Firmicutes bacterium]|nr:hypothetical protein [Bacillota bacterium]MDD4263751.1 hypothetical protein [Bacillota bacterium]MDD4694303.1 hypothetical protein [Bacillota bacterium]